MKPDGGPDVGVTTSDRPESSRIPYPVGGYAFPVPTYMQAPGMSLRDAFAMAALQGMMANRDWMRQLDEWIGDTRRPWFKVTSAYTVDPVAPDAVPTVRFIVATCAYEIADAMLAERSKP